MLQKREKRRWLFRRPVVHVQQCEPKNDHVETKDISRVYLVAADQQRHAIAVAAATAAAAEAAAVTAQAAVEIARLTRPASNFVRQQYAVVVIQTAFRGYLVSSIKKYLVLDSKVTN